MTKEGNYIIFAIEQYKNAMNMQGKDVVKLFEKYNIFNLIRKSYFLYHIESEKNMINDINNFIKEYESNKDKTDCIDKQIKEYFK